MKPTHTDNLACIIFGHNFYKSQYKMQGQNLVKCKNCNTALTMDEFETSTPTETVDNTFKNALRKLFLLKRHVA